MSNLVLTLAGSLLRSCFVVSSLLFAHITNMVTPSDPVPKEAGTIISATRAAQPASQSYVAEVPSQLEEIPPASEVGTSSTNTSTTDAVIPPTPVIGSHVDWMAQAGISVSDYTYVEYIIDHESSWSYLVSNASSGAYGLCQALPGGKMVSAGADWESNPITQLKWCNSYATQRYGSWYGAYQFWIANHWW